LTTGTAQCIGIVDRKITFNVPTEDYWKVLEGMPTCRLHRKTPYNYNKNLCLTAGVTSSVSPNLPRTGFESFYDEDISSFLTVFLIFSGFNTYPIICMAFSFMSPMSWSSLSHLHCLCHCYESKELLGTFHRSYIRTWNPIPGADLLMF
jgi:hypothetical protein